MHMANLEILITPPILIFIETGHANLRAGQKVFAAEPFMKYTLIHEPKCI